jgi:hypothetical protein
LISFLQERISNTHNKAKLCYALGLDLLIRDAKASLSKEQASLFKADRCNRKIIRYKERFSSFLFAPIIFLLQLTTSQGRWASRLISIISWVPTHEIEISLIFDNFEEKH